jgi:ATP-dependent Clp protease ATP-binding subunit ClpC
MRAIVDLELKKVTDRLKEKKLKLEISDEVKEFLIEKGYDNKLGARPLRRAVEKYLEDSLAEEVLSGSLRKNKLIRVLITDDEEPKLYFTQEEVDGKVSVSPSSKEEEKDLDS